MNKKSKRKHASTATQRGTATSANQQIRELVNQELAQVAGGEPPSHCNPPLCIVGGECGGCTCHCSS